MDRPDLDPSLHERALASLARLNRWACADRILWPAIRDLAASLPERSIRVLDLAAGAGDVPIALWRRAKRHGLRVEFTGVDLRPRAVDFARRRARSFDADIDFRQFDVLSEDLPGGYDVVTCSLFLHHLDETQALRLLERMLAASNRLVLVSDLRRSVAGLWLTHLAARLLTTSPVVRLDGARSVRGAFTVDEAASLARQAGWAQFRIQPVWPFRFLLSTDKGGS